MAWRQVRGHCLIAKLDGSAVVHDLIRLDRREGEGIAEPKIAMPAAAEQGSIAFAGHEFLRRSLS